MAITTLVNKFTAGAVLTASQLNESVIVRPSVLLRRTTTQTISNTTWTAVTFDTEDYDVDTMHDTAVNTDRITVTTPGIYLVQANVTFATNATGMRAVQIERTSGATVTQLYQTSSAAFASYETIVNVSMPISMAANDYVRCMVFQNSGGNLTLNAQANFSPNFFAATFMGKTS